MWITEKRLEKLLGGQDTSELRREIRKLKDELAELKTTKKMETREIEHLVKIKEEKLAIEHERSEVELQKIYQAKEMALQTQFHEKIMTAVESARKEQQETYKEIMKRLPNVNVKLESKS